MMLSSIMIAMGRRWARSLDASTPSRSEATQSVGTGVAGPAAVGDGDSSGLLELNGDGLAVICEAMAMGVACAVPPGVVTTSRVAATIATTDRTSTRLTSR